MAKLKQEIDAIKNDMPKFKFTCPAKDQVQRRKSFLNKSDKEINKIQEMIELLDSNPELRQIISERLK